ncbi:MAG: hypothetical protein RBJ76_17585 [Stenomitos frigidus ULC029]
MQEPAVNQDSFKNFQIGFAEVSRFLLPFAVVWLLGAIGLGWLVKSFFILVGLILITPVIAFFGFRWWLRRNLIQADCPVCQYGFVSLNQTEFSCPNCNEPLKVEDGRFNRLTPPGTIDVSAVEVSAKTIDD